jgi:protein transport protein SEC24
VFETRRENTHVIPPPADAPMVVRDLGSAPPRYMRSSVNMVPQSGDLLKSAALPFVVIVSPLAAAESGDDAVPVVDFGANIGVGPVRCAACKGYMNPYMRFVDGGRRFECNFCGKISDTPSDYFCPLGVDGYRQDRLQRPELCKGSVDVVATKEYMVRPPMPPVHFFLIETTPQALASGATAAACSSISKLLDDIDQSAGGEIAQVCIATFDTTIHYYSIRPGQSRPQMLIIPDVMDPYAPLSGNVIVKLRQSKQLLQKLLGSIPASMAADPAQGESCGGAAIKSAIEALKGGVGGRLRVFACTLPRRGVMQLRPRDSGRAPSDKDPLENMAPANKDWASLAADAADHQICIDLFLLATQPHLDVASLGALSTATCGQLYHYAPFHPAADADQFYNDLRWNLLRPQGYEAVGRLRVSDGLAVDAAFGSFHRRTMTDMNFPAISCDQSVAIRINYEGRLPEHGEATLQYALLYTTSDGQRRIRVHTLALPVTKSLGTVFRGADLDCFLGYLSRKVAGQIPNHSLGACKETMNRAAADALLAYRRHCASASSSGQLILPEALKLLPLYTLALTKLPCFRTEARPDIRAVWMFRLQSMTANKVVPSLYPRLVPVHRLLEQQEYQHQQANGTQQQQQQQQQSKSVKVPDKLWLSAEKLEPDGVYLLENGFECWLYFGKSVGPDVYSSLLGAPSLEAAAPAPDRPLILPHLDTPLSRAVNALLDEVRRQRGGYMRLRIPKRGGGDAEETAFFAALLEDRSMAGASYVEYLCWLHRQIQNKVT